MKQKTQYDQNNQKWLNRLNFHKHILCQWNCEIERQFWWYSNWKQKKTNRNNFSSSFELCFNQKQLNKKQKQIKKKMKNDERKKIENRKKNFLLWSSFFSISKRKWYFEKKTNDEFVFKKKRSLFFEKLRKWKFETNENSKQRLDPSLMNDEIDENNEISIDDHWFGDLKPDDPKIWWYSIKKSDWWIDAINL